MAFSGYLVKMGNMSTDMTISDSEIRKLHQFIIAQSYKVSKKIMDLGSFRDGDGVLRRNVLDHVSYTVNFSVRSMNNTQMQEFFGIIRRYFTVAKERKLSLTFYEPETNSYKTADVYMPDPEFTIDTIDYENLEIKYRETQIKFIGY